MIEIENAHKQHDGTDPPEHLEDKCLSPTEIQSHEDYEMQDQGMSEEP